MIDPTASTIEHLDFPHEQACESIAHAAEHPGDEPAMFEMFIQCPECHYHQGRTSYMCLPGWEFAGRATLQCDRCGATGLLRSACMTIRRVIGS